MLWYKAWQESRTRFLITAAVLTGFCFFAVLLGPQFGTLSAADMRGRIYHLIYSGTAKGLFAVLTIFLGLGGLRREQTHRVAIFTLALPVSRLRLTATEIAVGIWELATLSLLPVLWVPLLSALVRQPFPWVEALHFALLWLICSITIFAFAYFLSVTLEGQYVAPVACYIALMLQALIASWGPLRPYRLNLMWTMAEFPATLWLRLLILMLIAIVFFALAIRYTRREDF